MKKKIAFFSISILLIGVLGRIVYVNSTYPNARFQYLDDDEDLKTSKFSIQIKSAVTYSSTEWGQYIEKAGLELEENKHKIVYILDASKEEKFDYSVGYNPNAEYEVYKIDAIFTNITDEDIQINQINPQMTIHLVKSLSDSGLYFDAYYYKLFNDKLNSSKLKPNDGVECSLIYISNEKLNKAFAQVICLGNYQMKALKIENE